MARVFFAAFLLATLGAGSAAAQRRVVDLTAPDSLTLKATIFALNVSAFPGSPNAYDSLSDAYLAGGQKDLARANAQNALELLPSATGLTDEFRNAIRQSAEQKLKALGGPLR